MRVLPAEAVEQDGGAGWNVFGELEFGLVILYRTPTEFTSVACWPLRYLGLIAVW